ncbi:putative glucokinase regulator family protein [Poronia punctata]|nr:putative glucokinase regulator family protein [Poronia punctata]
MSTPVIQLAGLQTENRNARSANIDRVPTVELCRILNREDRDVPAAVESCLPVIAEVIDTLSERVRKGGRVFYIGAGTSGRLGVLDASEIPPTYSAPPGQFIALIAGGDHALRHAKEGAEDDRNAAEVDLQPFNLNPKVDSLIGIASSGRTPYVLGGLSYMKSIGATTVGLVCVSPSAIGQEGNADYLIPAVTGPEVVTGSTRMKAGTATKLVLNMISTGVMIKLGKTYGNLMIDVKATNLKLKQRARNILRFVGGDVRTQSDVELDQILESCRGSVKLAAVTIVLKVPVAEAEERLESNKGVLARVFEEARETETQRATQNDGLVLCVDAGGTNCKAVIMSKDGEMGMGTAGPCNLTNIGIDAAIATISKAIQEAINNCKSTHGQQVGTLNFSAAWVGMAGYGRPSLTSAIDSALSDLINLPAGTKPRITTDIDILPASVTNQEEIDSAVVVVAGTGSIAMSYSKVDGEFQRTHRVGGWGYLLGDDGSGYGIGREALRAALYSSDLYRLQSTATIDKLPSLSQAIFKHFKDLYPDSQPEDLLSTILVPDPTLHQAEDATLATTKRIAGVAKLVLSLAASDDETAKRIVNAGVSSLVDLVALLVRGRGIDPARSGLVLAGGMMKDDLYQTTLLKALEEKCGKFQKIESVDQPAVAGARYLLGRI